MFLTFNLLFNSKIYISNINFQNIHINNYKFIYKLKSNICILNFTLIALYLYKLYLYIYNISMFNNNILFINSKNNNYIINYFIIKLCKLINYNYILKWIPGLLTNWNYLKKKFILFIWLKFILFNNYYKQILSKKCLIKLNMLYNKLYLSFNGIKNIYKIPKYIFLTNYNDNLILNEIIKLKLILISFINLSINSNIINIKILGNYNNYNSLLLIFKIVYTAIIHSKIKNM